MHWHKIHASLMINCNHFGNPDISSRTAKGLQQIAHQEETLNTRSQSLKTEEESNLMKCLDNTQAHIILPYVCDK